MTLVPCPSECHATRLLLVDLSSLLYPIFHMSGKEVDVDHASSSTVARVHALSRGFDYVAVCCDSGRSFRNDIAPDYKGNRPERDEVLLHQMRVAQDTLRADGFPVWAVPGFEADDLIATAVDLSTPSKWTNATGSSLETPTSVVVASSDKDLLQLVDGRVSQLTLTGGGTLYGPDAVFQKFGVRPDQMRDYLILVGDASDNVKGVPGIGSKTARAILSQHGSIDALLGRMIAARDGDALGLKPAIYRSLSESVAVMDLARRLVSLDSAVPIPFADIIKPRNAIDTKEGEDMQIDDETGEVTEDDAPPPPATADTEKPEPPTTVDVFDVRPPSTALSRPSWSMELEPRSPSQAVAIANLMFKSKIFSAYGNPQAVLAAILTGRELGIGAMASLRGFHILEDGKISMSAGLMHALILRSGKAKYFVCTHRSNDAATFRTHRIGDADFFEVTYTMDDARLAKLVKEGGGWTKNPADMLVARAISTLARLKYPDVCLGLYTPEELGVDEMREAA